jgi:hypothetical protein
MWAKSYCDDLHLKFLKLCNIPIFKCFDIDIFIVFLDVNLQIIYINSMFCVNSISLNLSKYAIYNR